MNAGAIGFGIVVAGAIIVSAAAPRADRAAAMMLACGLAASWVQFITSWNEPNAAQILSRIIDTDSIDLWALFNCANALIALYVWHHNGRSQGWLILLYALLLSGLYSDVLWWAGWVAWASYKQTIDLISTGEMAVLYSVGGRGASRLVCDCFMGWRSRHSVRSAHAPSQAIALSVVGHG